MVVLLSTDENFVQHCCVTITSVLINNHGVEFYLFTEGLQTQSIELLKQQVERYDGKLTVIKIDHGMVSDFPMPAHMSSHITIATYYRLFAAKLLPADLDRVIYLDCDIVVDGSLQPLWETPLEQSALASVYQSHEHSDFYMGKGPRSYTRLHIPRESGYFNAGVLLINLDYWRKHQVTERLFAFIRNHHDLIYAHDQDTLNAVLYDETAVLAPTWNYRECFLESDSLTYPAKAQYDYPVAHPIVVHYVSKPKPWQYYCKHPLKELYFHYLRETPFAGRLPRWSWSEYKQFVLIPRLISFLLKLDVFKIRKVIRRPKIEMN